MMTFLPHESFSLSARALDSNALRTQLSDANMLLRALRRGSGGWSNHPVCRMWSGYEGALVAYCDGIARECIIRGLRPVFDTSLPDEWEKPWWLGDTRLHDSHRSVLLRQAPQFYGRYGWVVPDEFQASHYLWPRGKRGKHEYVELPKDSLVL